MDAINAGVDLLLVSYDSDQYRGVMHCLLQAQRQGRLQGQALNTSQRRVARRPRSVVHRFHTVGRQTPPSPHVIGAVQHGMGPPPSDIGLARLLRITVKPVFAL